MENLNWRKSSYSSGNGGECVEVADHANRVLVRDTTDRTGLMLRFTPDAWQRFADQVKRSLAPDPLPAVESAQRLQGRSRVSGAFHSLCRGRFLAAAAAGCRACRRSGESVVPRVARSHGWLSSERCLQVSWCGRRGAVCGRLCSFLGFLGHWCGGDGGRCTFRSHWCGPVPGCFGGGGTETQRTAHARARRCSAGVRGLPAA
jgi:hypothetical protein